MAVVPVRLSGPAPLYSARCVWSWLNRRFDGNGERNRSARQASSRCQGTAHRAGALPCGGGSGLPDRDRCCILHKQHKVYSTHRRVFDANHATLCLAADLPVSSEVVKRAKISQTRCANKNTRETLKTKNNSDIESLLKRRKRLERSADEIEREKIRSKTAKARMQQRNGD